VDCVQTMPLCTSFRVELKLMGFVNFESILKKRRSQIFWHSRFKGNVCDFCEVDFYISTIAEFREPHKIGFSVVIVNFLQFPSSRI